MKGQLHLPLELSPLLNRNTHKLKEALSIVFGIQKFHQYLYARHFTLLTDHKPLVAIFNPSKAIPPLSAARMQHWALLLAAYTYNICYRPTNLHANADALSRLPISNCTHYSACSTNSVYIPTMAVCLTLVN